jgi:hypothetical protein
MKRHWSTRLFGAALALWFGLAMAGPELHRCPLHDVPAVPAAAPAHAAGHASHGAPRSHQHCSCPQACCPAGVGVALAAVPVRWTAAVAAPVADATPVLYDAVLRGAPPHLLPFALAPPHALA